VLDQGIRGSGEQVATGYLPLASLSKWEKPLEIICTGPRRYTNQIHVDDCDDEQRRTVTAPAGVLNLVASAVTRLPSEMPAAAPCTTAAVKPVSELRHLFSISNLPYPTWTGPRGVHWPIQ